MRGTTIVVPRIVRATAKRRISGRFAA